MRAWFITICVTVVVQILVALVATVVAGPGIYPEYDPAIVRAGVFILAAVPLLDILRQISSARAHRSKKYVETTSPLRQKKVGIAIGVAATTVVVGVYIPWLVIPLFVVLAVLAWIGANT